MAVLAQRKRARGEVYDTKFSVICDFPQNEAKMRKSVVVPNNPKGTKAGICRIFRFM